MMETSAPRRAHPLDMGKLIGYVLLVGVLLSLALIAAGLIWRWSATGSLEAEYVIRGMNLSEFAARTIGRVAEGGVRPDTLLNLGICVLLLTPFVRVLASVVYFAAAEHNWKYTAFTSLVLVILTYSLFLR